jgi:hypothetical protein
VEGWIGDGAAAGIDPGIVPDVVVDDEGSGGWVPYGTLIAGSVVLGIADGEMPLGDTVLGTGCGV